MRTFKSLMISLCMGTTLCMCLPQTTTAQTVSSGDSWTWDKGTIVIDTPERPTGQKSVLGLTTPRKKALQTYFVYSALSDYHLNYLSQSTMKTIAQR